MTDIITMKYEKLHEKLRLLSNRVYYTPPDNIDIKHPCFIVSLINVTAERADNTRYNNYVNFRITYLTSNTTDVNIVKTLDISPTMTMEPTFIRNGLIHANYKITL